jgi:transposase
MRLWPSPRFADICLLASQVAAGKMVSMPKTRPAYPEQFRREAVGLVRSGRTIPDVPGSLGVSAQPLRNWVKRDQLERRDSLACELLGVSRSGYHARGRPGRRLVERPGRSSFPGRSAFGGYRVSFTVCDFDSCTDRSYDVS